MSKMYRVSMVCLVMMSQSLLLVACSPKQELCDPTSTPLNTNQQTITQEDVFTVQTSVINEHNFPAFLKYYKVELKPDQLQKAWGKLSELYGDALVKNTITYNENTLKNKGVPVVVNKSLKRWLENLGPGSLPISQEKKDINREQIPFGYSVTDKETLDIEMRESIEEILKVFPNDGPTTSQNGYYGPGGVRYTIPGSSMPMGYCFNNVAGASGSSYPAHSPVGALPNSNHLAISSPMTLHPAKGVEGNDKKAKKRDLEAKNGTHNTKRAKLKLEETSAAFFGDLIKGFTEQLQRIEKEKYKKQQGKGDNQIEETSLVEMPAQNSMDVVKETSRVSMNIFNHFPIDIIASHILPYLSWTDILNLRMLDARSYYFFSNPTNLGKIAPVLQKELKCSWEWSKDAIPYTLLSPMRLKNIQQTPNTQKLVSFFNIFHKVEVPVSRSLFLSKKGTEGQMGLSFEGVVADKKGETISQALYFEELFGGAQQKKLGIEIDKKNIDAILKTLEMLAEKDASKVKGLQLLFNGEWVHSHPQDQECIQKIVNGLQKMMCVSELDLSHNHISYDVLANILEELAKHTKLEKLHAGIGVGQRRGIDSFVKAILKFNTLRELDYREMDGTSNIKLLSKLDLILQKHPNLTSLNLSGNKIRNDQTGDLIKVLQVGGNLRVLGLAGTSFVSTNMTQVIKAFKFLTSLQELDLSQNIMDNKCKEELVSVLQELPGVSKLNLSEIKLKNPNKLKINISTVLADKIHKIKNLSELYLNNDDVIYAELKALLPGLQKCENLKSLYLLENKIETGLEKTPAAISAYIELILQLLQKNTQLVLYFSAEHATILKEFVEEAKSTPQMLPIVSRIKFIK